MEENRKYEVSLIKQYLEERGLVREQVNSFNNFVNTGLREVVRANDVVVSKVDPEIYVRFLDVRIARPSVLMSGVYIDINPKMCRASKMTYQAPIMANIEHVALKNSEKRVLQKRNFVIGYMPIMLQSCACVLDGKDEDGMIELGECPLDPGGYFIIEGIERVILIQEQLSKNRIFVDTDKNGNLYAFVSSQTKSVHSETVIQMENDRFYLSLTQFEGKIPIVVVLKAMGMTDNEKIEKMIAGEFSPETSEEKESEEKKKSDDSLRELLADSILECFEIRDQNQALDYLQRKVKLDIQSPVQERALNILRDIFLANVPVRNNNFHPKCVYVGLILKRMMEVKLKRIPVDDKDNMGNKVFELSGKLVLWQFEALFKQMTTELKNRIDKILSNPRRPGRQLDVSEYIKKSVIGKGLEWFLGTGNFNIKKFNRKGVTQVLNRRSFIGTLSHLIRVSPSSEKSKEVSKPRALHSSQCGMFCPCDTPIGEACGLVKHLALMAHFTTDVAERPLISSCYHSGVKHWGHFPGEELHNPNSLMVIFNGQFIGYAGNHSEAQHFVGTMREKRRDGSIGKFVSVFVNENQHCVYIASDGGRICRPLVIADKGKSRIKEQDKKELSDGIRTFDDFVRDQLIEYLDVNEENNALIALHEREATPHTTHIEIEPFTMLGVCAGIIPNPHHNQSWRNIYQCAMGKQAVGNIAYNQLHRMDELLHLLVYPQRPLLTTSTIELVGYDKLGAGQNAIVAVMSYSGYDINDAIVMNKSSLERGFGRSIEIKRYSASSNAKRGMKRLDSAERMQILDEDGLATPGEIIRHNDIYFIDMTNLETRKKYTGPEGKTCSVDRVALFSHEDMLHFRFLIRHSRQPEIGDIFSSRHGQKGVCGSIVGQEDLPFTEGGICPDLTINPASGEAVGMMIEVLAGKVGASFGKVDYGNAFAGHADRVEAICDRLVKHGFNYSGKDFLYSGITGEQLEAYIFMGPIYYQRSRHMVIDKMRARSVGPRDIFTRQPTQGESSRSAPVRFGEMERDCLIAHGASMAIYERLMISGDPTQVEVCRECGLLGYYNHELKVGVCSTCKNANNMSTIQLPYAFKLLIQELQSINVVPRLKLKEWRGD